MFYTFRNENGLKFNNSFYQNLVEKGVLYAINENKRFFDTNCEKYINVFVRFSQVRNEKNSDVDFSDDYDDYYSNDKNEKPPLSEGVGTFWCANISNVMISNDSLRND